MVSEQPSPSIDDDPLRPLSTSRDPRPGGAGSHLPGVRDPFRQLRTVRWLGIGFAMLQYALVEPSAGLDLPFSRWWVLLVVAPEVWVNVMEERAVRAFAHQSVDPDAPLPRWVLRVNSTRWGLIAVTLDTLVCASVVAMFAFDPISAVWSLMILPVLHASVRFGIRGALSTWAFSTLTYLVTMLWAASHYPQITFFVDSFSYRMGLLLLVSWATGHLSTRLRNRMSDLEAMQLVNLATEQFHSLRQREIVEITNTTLEVFGYQRMDVLWRTDRENVWRLSTADRATPLMPGEINAFTESILAASHYRGLMSLPDNNPNHPCVPRVLAKDSSDHPLPVDHHPGGSQLLVLVGWLFDRAPLVLITRANDLALAEARTLRAVEALLKHTATALIAFGQEMARAEFMKELDHKSKHDDLTELPNRASLTTRVDQALAEESGIIAVVLLDLNRFKEINDTLGHTHGDELLRKLADRLRRLINPRRCLARLGGDEFALMASGLANRQQVLDLADQVRALVEEPFQVHGILLDLEAGIGVAYAPDHGSSGYELLRCADIAMYAAKQTSGAISVYDPDQDENTPERLTLLGDLKRALSAQDELHLVYQPLVELNTSQVDAVEALLRWTHPTRGTVMPADFIPAAEGTALVQPMTLYVLDQALAQIATWSAAGLELVVCVNISTRCLLEPGFAGDVAALLRRHHLPARLLRLEITESSLIADPQGAITVLSTLSSHGVQLSIDDYGTGYSSLSYLKNLPVDELKVDRSFVTDLLSEGDDATLVRSVVDLGHNLGLRVVAEGVEHQSTMTALRLLGCDVAQGYLLSRPIPPEQIPTWMRAWRDRAPNVVPDDVATRPKRHRAMLGVPRSDDAPSTQPQ